MSGSSDEVSKWIAQSFANIDEVYIQTHRLVSELVREVDLGLQEIPNAWVRPAIATTWTSDTDWHTRYVSMAWATERSRCPELVTSHGLVFFSLLFQGWKKTPIPTPLLITGFHGNDRAESMMDAYRDLWWQPLENVMWKGHSLGATKHGGTLKVEMADAMLQLFSVPLTSINSLEAAGSTVLEPLRSLAKGKPATPPSAVTEKWMLKD